MWGLDMHILTTFSIWQASNGVIISSKLMELNAETTSLFWHRNVKYPCTATDLHFAMLMMISGSVSINIFQGNEIQMWHSADQFHEQFKLVVRRSCLAKQTNVFSYLTFKDPMLWSCLAKMLKEEQGKESQQRKKKELKLMLIREQSLSLFPFSYGTSSF